MYNKKRILRLIIFYTIILIGTLYISNIMTSVTELLNDETVAQFKAINAERQGFSAYREMGMIYVLYVIFGFNYLHDTKIARVIKYKSTVEYLNKEIIRDILINSIIFTIVHRCINVIYNLIYLNNSYLIDNNFYILNFIDGLIFFMFFIIILMAYNIIAILLKRNISMAIIVIISTSCYFFADNHKNTMLPHAHISKMVTMFTSGTYDVAIISIFMMSCYIIIFYFLLQEFYKKKEFI